MKSYAGALGDAAAVGLPKDFLSVLDFTPESLRACLALAAGMKQARRDALREIRPLAGRHVALLF
jgi:ornithine carbamoyltransferase